MNKPKNAEMKDFTLRLAERLRALRLSGGVRQSDLAHLLDLDRTAIVYYEQGKISLHSYYLAKLCKYYGVSADLLLMADDANFAAYLAQQSPKTCP